MATMNYTDKETNSNEIFDSPPKCTHGIGALGRATNNNDVLPPWASSVAGHHFATNLNPPSIELQLNVIEFLQSSVHDRKVALFEKFSKLCLMMTRGWITALEAEAFYRRMEYLLTEGTSLMQMENVVQRNTDYLEKLLERQNFGNLSADLQKLETSLGPEVMKNFYCFRSFVVNLLSSDEHASKLSHLNTIFECLIITKKVQSQMQGAEQQKSDNSILKRSMFHLSECVERIEGKILESVEKALDETELQENDFRHLSYQSLSDKEKLEARRSCELRNETLSNLTFSALWLHRCWPYMKQYSVGKTPVIEHIKLLALREGYMINNFIIDAYFSLLQGQCKASEFFICDLHVFSKSYSANDIELKALFHIMMKTERILFPIHVDGIHFHLALITKHKKSLDFDLDIFDSLRVSQRAHKEKYYARVLELMSKVMLAGGHTNYEVQQKSFPLTGEQQNGCDCGIFMCMIAASLTGIIDVKWFDIDQNYITSKNCRASICASLITGKIQSPLP